MEGESLNEGFVDSSPILQLPPEIIFEIFKFVDFHTLFKVVIVTCKHFYNILSVDDIWKTLFAMKWKEEDIVNDLMYICDQRDVCFCYEEIDEYWRKKSRKRKRKVVHCEMPGHFAAVDDVHIMAGGSICVSGSRDRTGIVWDLSNFQCSDWVDEKPKSEVLKGHQGWVWSVDSDPNKPNVVVTSSWDQTVKEWDLNNNTELKDNHMYHPAAILGLCCHDNVYTTACFDRTVRTYDPRSQSIVLKSKHHKKPVLCIQVTDKYILSGSEDQTIGVFDVRGGKLITSLCVDSPVLCMNLASAQGFRYLRAGGRNGSIFIFDMSNDRFTLLNSTQLWQNHGKVNQLCNYRGAVAACSQTGAVCMYSPDRNFNFLEKFEFHVGDVAGAHSYKGLLVTAGSDSSAVAWKFD